MTLFYYLPAESRKTLAWKRYTTEGNIVDLLKAVGVHENATAYAFVSLLSEVGGNAEISLGSDDGVAIWMNGQRVHHNPVNRPITLDEDVFEADFLAGLNRCLVKVGNGIGRWEFAMRVLPPERAVISGRITDENGGAISQADVRLEQNEEEIAQTQTDDSGNYRMNIYPVRGRYDLSATNGNLGDWRLEIPLREGDRRHRFQNPPGKAAVPPSQPQPKR